MGQHHRIGAQGETVTAGFQRKTVMQLLHMVTPGKKSACASG
jgi:hypothetical protein